MKNVKNVKVKASLLIMGVAVVVATLGILVSKSNAAYTQSILKNTLQVMNAGSFGNGIITGVDGATNGLIVLNGKAGIGTAAPAATLAVGGTGSAGTGIYGIGSSYGVQGNTDGNGIGVNGITAAGTGVYGQAASGWGVYGYSYSNTGVYGFSYNGGNGVYGRADSGAAGVYGSTGSTAFDKAGVAGVGGGTGVYGNGTNYGVFAQGGTIGLYANGAGTGIVTNSCPSCSVLAEMVQVSETPTNGDIMCTNPNTGKTEICREDKSGYIKGIAQKYAETVMRMGCNKTLDKKTGENNMAIGVMDVDAWQNLPECKGWYPIALSGLSEKTNVVCETPSGKRLGYGDILVSSNIAGHLRPLDKDEAVQFYQVAGRVDTLCAAGKKTDSIMVWIQ